MGTWKTNNSESRVITGVGSPKQGFLHTQAHRHTHSQLNKRSEVLTYNESRVILGVGSPKCGISVSSL